VYAELLDARGGHRIGCTQLELAADIGKLAALGLELNASPSRNAESRADATGARRA